MLESRVAYRVVGPRRDLVQTAVAGPGQATAGLRYLKAKARVGNHVDPRPGRDLSALKLELKLATLRVKMAQRCNSRCGGGCCRVQGGRRRTAKKCRPACRVGLLKLPVLAQGRNLHLQRAAIGRQHDPGKSGQRGLLASGCFMLSQQVKT